MDFTKKAVMENREYGIENGEWQTFLISRWKIKVIFSFQCFDT